MAWGYGQPVPKPVKGTARRTRRTTREARERALRNAVWMREMAKSDDGYAYCQRCRKGPLRRNEELLHPLSGHVAHRRGRNVAPADKYNPDACELACSRCHLGQDHHMRFA